MPAQVAAPAKINLFLHVTGKRADGYHLLESLVAFADIGDQLEITPADTLTLDITGPFAPALAGSDNIVLRAARALQQQADIAHGAKIILNKQLPVASGIGGGSADAAACLRGLMRLWNVQMNEAPLAALALALGSDVPVCLTARAAWMRGAGEALTPATLPKLHAVLINPGVAVATADVFRAFSETFESPLAAPEHFASAEALLKFLICTQNSLEPAALALAPVIGNTLAALRKEGALLARMSGSGATCFGIYRDAAAAALAAARLTQAHPGWWCRATTLG